MKDHLEYFLSINNHCKEHIDQQPWRHSFWFLVALELFLHFQRSTLLKMRLFSEITRRFGMLHAPCVEVRSSFV